MKQKHHYLISCAFLMWLVFLKPVAVGNAQLKQNNQNKKTTSFLDILHNKRRQLFEEAFANQDTLKMLDSNLKPKKIIVNKIQYVKVYKTVPVYVPENDSNVSNDDSFKQDTLENDYLIANDSAMFAPVQPQGELPHKDKKEGFFHKLFHHKDND